MNTKCIRLWIFLTICSCSNCILDLPPANGEATNSPNFGSFPTELQVGDIVKEGVSRETVIKAFGPPMVHDQKPGEPIWYDIYFRGLPKRATDPEAKAGFSGFKVNYKHDQVTSLSPVESRGLLYYTNTTTLDDIQGTNVNQNVALYVVDDPPTERDRYIDTPSLPHLGFIKSNPNFVAQNIASVELTESDLGYSNSGKRYDIHIRFSIVDAKALENLVAQNFGKRILIMIDGEPVVAPFLLVPISDGQFNLSYEDKKSAKEIMRS
jgi:hypothetical protein